MLHCEENCQVLSPGDSLVDATHLYPEGSHRAAMEDADNRSTNPPEGLHLGVEAAAISIDQP